MARRQYTSSNWSLLLPAARGALLKLAPRREIRNPVMFVVYIGAIWTTISVIIAFMHGDPWTFSCQIALWLWFTVLFANFAEAMAEGRGKAQADSLKRARTQVFGRLLRDGAEIRVPATDLKRDDLVVCDAGDVIPADGDVVDGIASVDESAITGESAPVIRESGGDRSAVTGGTKVLSDRI
ncbi:MAG: potassium-transporting ATPase subunit B, partial [candidate division Zixibacteria bacterium]|nr:potassium-transporting ATPase subunit B [candidate division Zixibacteria bacterium]